MKNSLKKIFRVLAIGVAAALLGHALAGCDGGGSDLPEASGVDGGAGTDARPGTDVLPRTDVQGPGLGRTDAGLISCEVPSPTREWGEASTSLVPGHFVVLTGDVVRACEAWKVENPTLQVPVDGYQVPRGSEVSTAGVDCMGIADDFRGSTGLFWCVGPFSCTPSPDGKTTCEIWGLGLLKYSTSGAVPPKTLRRTWAACSPEGVFVGWLCT
jgi:hypothetical protein